jgi:protein kinase C substrate 80K-H
VALADLHRGTNPRNQHLYNPVSNSKFKCIKSGELIDITSLNDDYCDCADGSDEPGTSACAHLSKKPNTFVGFWCRNAGFQEQTISPMIVDDGICDCCDGTDEVLKKCENTCDQVGAIDREKRAAEIAVHAEGIALKKKWVEDGKKAHAERDAEIVEIEADMAELEKKATELKAEKDRVCEIEKIEKQRCLDADKLKQEIVKKEKRDNAIRNAYRQLDLNGDGVLTAEEVLTFNELKPASEDDSNDNPTDEADNEEENLLKDEPRGKVSNEMPVPAAFTLEQAKQLLDGESTNPESFASVTWDLISEHFDEDGWLPGNEPTEPPTLPPQEEQIEEISNDIDDDTDNVSDPEEDFADEFDSDDDDFDDEDDDDEDDKSWKDDDRNYDDYRQGFRTHSNLSKTCLFLLTRWWQGCRVSQENEFLKISTI